MRKWFYSILIGITSLSVIYWAFTPIFITYAQVIPTDVQFDFGDVQSIPNAIISVMHDAIESSRERYGRSLVAVSAIAIVNATIAIYFILKKKG